MGRTRPPYPAEFRAEAVRLARSVDRSVSELARELGVSPQTLTNGSLRTASTPVSTQA